MRLALLSTLDSADAPGEQRAAYRVFGGIRLVERQLDIALGMGAKTVACLTDTVGKEVIELQHRAEHAGARFVVLREAHGLLGLATTADDLLVIASGLLPDSDVLAEVLEKPAILTFPAEPSVRLGYERIDAESAWAGAMVTRASLVEQLADLPMGIDPISSLLRLALQAGTPRRPVPLALLEAGDWQLAPVQAALDERAQRWVRQRAAPAPFTAPGTAAAERMGARLSRDLFGRTGAQLPTLGAALFAIVALVAAYFEWPLVSLGATAAMTILVAMGRVVARVLGDAEGGNRNWLSRTVALLVDPVLAVALALTAPEADGWLRLYVPVVMLAVLGLAARLAPPKWRATFSDRVILSLLFLPAALFGVTQILAAALTIAVLVSLFRILGPQA